MQGFRFKNDGVRNDIAFACRWLWRHLYSFAVESCFVSGVRYDDGPKAVLRFSPSFSVTMGYVGIVQRRRRCGLPLVWCVALRRGVREP